MTSDVVRATLSHIWDALGKHGYKRALMGDVALATWNHPRATRDVDLLIDVSRNDVDLLVAQLSESGLRPKRDPPLNIVGEHGFLQFLYTPQDAVYDVQLDLMLAESAFQQSAIQRRVARDVPGVNGPIEYLVARISCCSNSLLDGSLIRPTGRCYCARIEKHSMNLISLIGCRGYG